MKMFTYLFLCHNRRVLRKAIEVAECLERQHTNVLLIGKNLVRLSYVIFKISFEFL